MSQVNFYPTLGLSSETIKKELKNKFTSDKKVIIKVHFGEPGNKTAFTPEDISPYTKALAELGFEFDLLDTPVNYTSPRKTKEGYEKAAKERGYDKLWDIIISDTSINNKVGDTEFDVAQELADAENVLVISHVKGQSAQDLVELSKTLEWGHCLEHLKHKEVKKELWGGRFWTSGYYANTVGQYGNEEVIKRYVENQGMEYQMLNRENLTLFEIN